MNNKFDIFKFLSESDLFVTFDPDKLKAMEREYNLEFLLNPDSKKCKELKSEIEKYKKKCKELKSEIEKYKKKQYNGYTSDTGPR